MLGDGERHRRSRPRTSPPTRRGSARSSCERCAELAAGDRSPPTRTRSSDCEFCHWWKRLRGPAPRRRPRLARRQPAPRAGPQARGRRRPHGRRRSPSCRPRRRGPAARATRRSRTLRAQADLQLRSRGLDAPAVRAARARARPRPGAAAASRPTGDVFFDFEGDPYWGDDGLEYLFGTVYRRGRRVALLAAVGDDARRGEARASRQWMDWITARLDAPPRPARLPLQRLRADGAQAAGRAPRDARARGRRAAAPQGASSTSTASVRQAVRAGVESYGLKALEPRHRLRARRRAARRDRLAAALAGLAGRRRPGAARRHRRLQRGRLRARRARCYDWLLDRRPEAEAQYGIELDALAARAAQAAERPSSQRTSTRLEAMRRAADRRPARRRVRGRPTSSAPSA